MVKSFFKFHTTKQLENQALNSEGNLQLPKFFHYMQEAEETLIRSLGQEDPQEKEMATYSSILAWEIPWTEESGGLQSGKEWGVTACTHSFP